MTDNVKVAISSDFLTAFARLPRQVQGKVTEFVNKFRNNPMSPGINYEKLNSGIDKKIFSVRIDDTYRGIVVRQQEVGVYLLLWVDHHDEAYQWAARKKCEVNPKTGAIQVFDVETMVEKVSAPDKVTLFALAKDDELLKLGVPEIQLDFVRSFISKEDFYKAEQSMPHDAYEHLSWLAEGFPMEEVLELVLEEQNASSANEDLAAALDVPTTLKSFVVVDGEDELRRIMAEPLEKWRVFLHPTQRKIARKEYSGSARVLGGAGTGKTVVAMHRAKHLASKCEGQQRILMTTFTANLAADIRENLRKICTLEELRRIEVIHLDAWVNQFLRESGFSAQIGYDDVIKPLWERAVLLANIDMPFETSFYEEEWNRIVIAQEALTLEKYVKATRNGRGTRLDRKKRMHIWKVFENYQNLMKEKQIRDINTAMYESTKLLQSAGRKPRYASIIIDEGQDFSDNAYRLIRALAGEEHPNDIFIVGDSHQRIYRNHPTLSKCGINVRGRSSILKINYRTTEEIRKQALVLLKGISFDDLDEGFDLGDKCQSLTHGEKPIFVNFVKANYEFDFLVREVKKLKVNGVSLTDICVVAGTKKLVDDYIALFTKAGIRSYAIKRNKVDDRSFDGLRVATMHRVKGLEFKYVFIAAVNNRIIPLSSAINKSDAVSEEESITSEKCLLYVAMTRAQKGVYITSYGRKSEFLE
ncbi:UvrD-helicase domain-containing protein [Phascolarctobacterium succinatutens]|uniref:UvrD-helicase domain-containing protein n=1 Tax=Phascolarctobacterium succinatutens TaxID=626940 RepID=UPI0023F90676|nr:UvrD-helicase domain-containing protein [Phascolarctobacterium succinatutens]